MKVRHQGTDRRGAWLAWWWWEMVTTDNIPTPAQSHPCPYHQDTGCPPLQALPLATLGQTFCYSTLGTDVGLWWPPWPCGVDRLLDIFCSHNVLTSHQPIDTQARLAGSDRSDDDNCCHIASSHHVSSLTNYFDKDHLFCWGFPYS